MIELVLLGLGCFLAGMFVYISFGPDKRKEFLLATLLLVFVCLFALDVKLQRDLLGPQIQSEVVASINSGYACFERHQAVPISYGFDQPVDMLAVYGLNLSNNSSASRQPQ